VILLDNMDAYSSGQGAVGDQVRLANARLELTEDERDAINIWCAIRGWAAFEIQYQRPDLRSTRLKALLSERLSTLGVEPSAGNPLSRTIDDLGELMYVSSKTGYKFAGMPSALPSETMTEVTGNEEAAMTLQLLIQSIDPDDWSVRAMIVASVAPTMRRQPVASQILTSRQQSSTLDV
jgi:hypothetical protein